MTDTDISNIAKICHEANKAYCETCGDFSQLPWEQAPEWQRQSAISGVKFKLENPDAPDSALHDEWVKQKVSDGWNYTDGPKDPVNKLHPCIVPYDQLPAFQRVKDALFSAVVTATKRMHNTVYPS